MPISASAKKSLRVGLRRQSENRSMKARIKNQLKATTLDNVGVTYSLLDKAAKNHIIHANKAARLKSRLAKKFLSQQPEAKAAAPKPVKKRATKTAKSAKAKK